MAERGLSPKALVEATGWKQPFVSAILNDGKSSKNIGPKTLKTLTEVFQVDERAFDVPFVDHSNQDHDMHSEATSVIESHHFNVIKRFIDKAYALKLNTNLSELEHLSPETYRKVGTYIEASLDAVRTVLSKENQSVDRRTDNDRRQSASGALPGGKDRRSGKERRTKVG